MDLNRLWKQILGTDIDDKTLLAQEQQKVEKLKEATKIMKERQVIRNQIMTAQKERKELEAGLGKSNSRLIMCIAGLGALLVIVLIMRSCVGC